MKREKQNGFCEERACPQQIPIRLYPFVYVVLEGTPPPPLPVFNTLPSYRTERLVFNMAV